MRGSCVRARQDCRHQRSILDPAGTKLRALLALLLAPDAPGADGESPLWAAPAVRWPAAALLDRCAVSPSHVSPYPACHSRSAPRTVPSWHSSSDLITVVAKLAATIVRYTDV